MKGGKYFRIFHCLPDAASVTRVSDGTLLDCNEAFERLTGCRRGETIGLPTAQLGCWVDPARLGEAFRKLEETDAVCDLGMRLRRADGGLVDVLIKMRRLEMDGEPCCLSVARDISECRKTEPPAREGEGGLSPDMDISGEDVLRIMDLQAIQEMISSFNKLTGIAMALLDPEGNILAAAGWQDICTKFHRVHPQAGAKCVESDVYLSRGVKGEKYRLYKCRNNIWDMATPINVGGKHVASLFLGQFHFDDETPDVDAFVRQAEAYGFDKEEYLAALERIPRCSRETAHNVMEIYAQLARMIAELSYRNVRLVKALCEQKRTEAALRESEEKFARAFSAAPSLLCISTIAEGRYLEVNESFERFSGYRREEVIGSTSVELNIWETETRARFLEAIGREGRVRNFEAELRSKSGERRAGLLSTEVIEIKGEKCLLILIDDITEQKRTEEALKISEMEKSLILNSTMDIVLYLDREMKTLWRNRRAHSLAGLRPGEPEGLHCWEIWRRTEACSGCPAVSALATGERQHAEMRFDGGTVWHVRGFPVKDDDGKVTGIVVFCHDITAKTRLEEEAQMTRKKLIQADKMASLGLLVSGIAHEVNNPNNFIMINSTILSEAWQSALPILDEYYRETGDFTLGDLQFSRAREIVPRLFSGLLDGSQRIRNIVDKLKGFARHDSGSTRDRVEVDKVIQDAVAILDHEIKKQCENFRLEVGCGLPPALGNAQQIEQVMINLLMNALQALPDTKRGIRVAGAVAEDGKHIAVTVTDEGVGIPREALERLTEPFFTTRSDCGGTGLGLSVSASILRNNHGGLSFVSEPGRGTTATVLLQICRQPERNLDRP